MSLVDGLKRFLVGDPPPPPETKDADAPRVWEDYRGRHVLITKGANDGIRHGDLFYIIHPDARREVTHPDTGEVLRVYYENMFRVYANSVHDTWTECDVWLEWPGLGKVSTDGARAIFQYNYDEWVLKHLPEPRVRLP